MDSVCYWVTPSGRTCTSPAVNSKYCDKHLQRYRQLKTIAQQCVESECKKSKAMERCKCHLDQFSKHASILRDQPWWPEFDSYIEKRIQMGIRQALKDAQITLDPRSN